MQNYSLKRSGFAKLGLLMDMLQIPNDFKIK